MNIMDNGRGLGLTGHGPQRLIVLHIIIMNGRLTHSAS